jgi:hypothetical protein
MKKHDDFELVQNENQDEHLIYTKDNSVYLSYNLPREFIKTYIKKYPFIYVSTANKKKKEKVFWLGSDWKKVEDLILTKENSKHLTKKTVNKDQNMYFIERDLFRFPLFLTYEDLDEFTGKKDENKKSKAHERLEARKKFLSLFPEAEYLNINDKINTTSSITLKEALNEYIIRITKNIINI